jgi:excinuclease UvrABC ATPase subunit
MIPKFIEGKNSFRMLVLGCTVSKSTTLSGGEAQRNKLAENCLKDTGNTFIF